MKISAGIGVVLAAGGIALAAPAHADENCGYGLVAVGPTSCPFAVNVRNAFMSHGTGTVVVYSPVTGENYSMDCERWGTTVTCSGIGNNAQVEILPS